MRIEASAAPDDPGACGRRPQGDAPSSEVPVARWTSKFDPNQSPFVTGHGADFQKSQQNETSAAPAELVPTADRRKTAIAAADTAQAGTGSDDGPAGAVVRPPRGGGNDDDLPDRCNERPHSVMATVEAVPTETRGKQATCNDTSIWRNEPAVARDNMTNESAFAADVGLESPTYMKTTTPIATRNLEH